MSGDSGDSSSDHSEKPSCSKRITRRSKNAAPTSSCSTSANAETNGSGNKKKRRIVMRIEFDGDSDDTSTTSGSSSALSEVDDDDDVCSGGRGDGGRGNKRKAETKRHQQNKFIDDEEVIKPCSTRKLRGKLGKKTNFVFNSDDINNNSSEDDMPGSSTRRNNRHQPSNKNRLRNRQRLEDNNDDDDEIFDEKNNANGGKRDSNNGREIARTVGSRKRNIISDDEDDNTNVASSMAQENNRDEENGFNSDSSSNELLEKCPICLLTFRGQEIGSPVTCEHIFCANCIEAWSKNVQTCPIDRIEFDRIVVRDSYENREIVREINVSKTNGAEKLNHELSDEDVTHCEVCNRPDREDVMLLCDSCNQGYHIDCLTPPLSNIPEGSWYCDNCFDSENSDDSDVVDDLNVLYEDIRDMGIPESRYRVTEVYQPRILRTRQNERIRAAILSRTRSGARNQAVEPDAASTSNRTASSSRTNRVVRNSSRSTKTRRRRKRRARQRTYVVEYDLNNFDEKFAIKTTKRIIKRRRRRRTTRRTAPNCRQMDISGGRMTASKRLAEQLGVKSTDREVRAAASSQSFSLFGNANDLEYFSDSDGGLQSEIQIETGGSGSTAVQTSVRISNFRTHRNKKGLLSRLEREQPSSTPDLLSNIMELQDRWHNASRHLDSVRIGQDGSLNLPSAPEVITNPPANTSPAKPNSTNTAPSNGVNQNDVTEAPMYPRGGSGGGGNNRNFNTGSGGGSNNSGGGGNYNNRYNNQTNYRGSGGGGSSGGGQFRSSFGASGTSNTGNLFSMVGRGNFSFSSQTYNQHNDNDNNGQNNNRDRFNQRNNSNNNRHNRNSLPLFNNNQTTENLSSMNSNPPLLQQQPLQPRPLLSIPTVQNIQSPQFQLSPAHQQHQTAQAIPSLTSLPLLPPIGLYSSLPPTSALPPLFRPPPPILSQPPPIIPIRTAPSVIPPLAAPPAFNSSLFQLTADYGNDDDDDSNCPNFSVYSMESLQVAKSDVKAASETKGDTPKEDDENEDLVQLSDDDEMTGNNDEDIPLPPPLEKNENDKANETANNDPDLYEPDQPTLESEDDSGSNEDESKIQNENNETAESQTPPGNDMELENSDNTESSLNVTAKVRVNQNDDTDEEAEAVENTNQGSDKEDDETHNLLDIQLPASSKKVEQSQRKGVLELYDDSDWEELNMEKPTAEDYQLKTPPQEKKKSQETEKENHESDDDESDGEVKHNDEEENNDTEGGEQIDKHEENCRRSPGSIEMDINTEDKAEDDDEKDKEQDRSYTPCLDEKNDNIDEDENEGICTPELIGSSALASGLDAAKNANKSESGTAVDTAGIAGMETELISEDDDSDKRDKRKRSKGEKDKEQFKKISKNQKDRNYRTERASADRLRRRGRSRSRTNDKENQGFSHRRAQRGRFKRRELPRYNVRNVVNQRNFKDRYGRDTSRPRSASRPRRRRSYSRSVSRSRSGSRSKSRSRSLSSPSKRPRRSFSISPSPPNIRRHSLSPRRRMRSPMNRSPVRRNSRTPLRMRSRSNSPMRHLNKQKAKRGPGKRSISPGKRSRSLSRFTPRLSRSRTPPRHKTKRTKDRKKKKGKKRQASQSSQRSRSRLERRKGSGPPNKRKRHHTPKANSPVGDQGWSPSPSPPRNYLHDNVSWTPPLMSPAGVSRLRRNEEYNEFSIPSKPPKEKKKRDKKKKKSEKRRGEIARKEKRRRDAAPNAPSKEVFASGNNILVSVSFNKEGNQPQQTTVVTLPPTREEVLASIRGRSKERQNDQQPKKKKKKDGREKKRKKLETKPVAIIDLERSPFQVTQEQTDIIILTDSEGGGNDEENLNVSRDSANEMMTQMDHHHPREGSSHRTVNSDKTPPLERLESILEESYENAIQQQGPKTPPEPPGGIKFNLINKNKQKINRNVLHDEADLDSDGHQEEERQEERESMTQNANKIGPNTPPESGPCSPDVYDPFDPTKSPSMSPRSPTPPPDMSHDSVPDTDTPTKHSTEDLRSESRQPGAPGAGNTEKSALNPVDLVMVLMNNKTNTSQDSVHKSNDSQYNSSQTVVNLIDENDKPEESSSNVGITVLSNVILSSGKSQHIPSISSPPLSKASSHKPPKLTNILSNLPGIGNRHNGGGMDDTINDIESPYSPGSADYEDLFEPPPDTNGTKRRRGDKRPNKTGEVFESLFGSSSPPPPGAAHLRLPTSTARKHKPTYPTSTRNKPKMIVKVSKLPGNSNDDHVKVYDDLPNSAVELQVKDKFLRKLNRQERVVEEVKMILKPRFNKKQITKDDYKEIMRRAVPKICHSKSGEINPKKIQNLIEAYVKKFRQKHKKLSIPNTGQVSSAVKCAAYLKKL